MRTLLFAFLTLLFVQGYGQQTLEGIVVGKDGTLQNAHVQNITNKKTVVTDDTGTFSLEATINDKIRVSHEGKKDFIFIVKQQSKPIKIMLSDDQVALDEVLINEAKGEKQARKKDEDKRILSAFGYRKISGITPSDVLTSKEIERFPPNLFSLLRSMPGLRVIGYGGSAVVVLRRPTPFGALRNTTIPISWDIDGMVTQEIPTWLDVQLIDRIVLLKSPSQTNPYGTVGASGVLVINTTNVVYARERSRLQKENEARKYKEQTVTRGSVNASAPRYIQLLQEHANDEESAYAVYEEQKKFYSGLVDFYVYNFEFFRTHFDQSKKALPILMAIEESFPEDIEALRVLAYKLDEYHLFEHSRMVYRKIAKQTPDIQSIRDLANVEANIGKYRLSENIYNGLIYEIHDVAENDGIKDLLKYERNWSSKRSGETARKQVLRYEEGDDNDVEIIFEWNNQNAQFELQFIDPTRLYHSWYHTSTKAAEELNYEEVYGFSSERFSIQDLNGPWKVNLKYLGNETAFPTYLKLTVRNHKTEEEKIKVYRLSAKGINQTIAQINLGQSSLF